MAGDRRFSGVALGAIATGGVLVYAGIKGYSIPQTVQDLIQGKNPLRQTQSNPITATATEGAQPGGDSGAGLTTGSGSPGGGTDTENQALGRFMAAAYGWGTGAQWDALNSVAMDESGWNNQIYNGGTVGGPYQPNKAYGIAQALGHGPDGAPYPAGSDANPPGAGGTSSATAQIAWMLAYIKDTYTNPEGALNSEQTRGYY